MTGPARGSRASSRPPHALEDLEDTQLERFAQGELAPAALAVLLADPEARAGLTLVDVREGWERRVDRIEAPEGVTDRHLPLDELLDAPDRLSLDGAETVVLWCAAGVRSARARETVASARPELAGRLHTLAGGLEA